MPLSAYVPCYNAARTVRRAVESVLAQTVPPDELLVIDDGSTDGSRDALEGLAVKVLSQPRNLGRGAARDLAMRTAAHELVLCCDATNTLDPRFVEHALSWFNHASTAAVIGRITQSPPSTLAERWRGRHLFKTDLAPAVNRRASLSTGGTLMRAAAVREVGGYDARLRHSEDIELGGRLIAAGFDVVFDPALTVTAIASNTLAAVLERHWRWNAGVDETATVRGYARSISYSIRHMARTDLVEGDFAGALVSLLSPHDHFWRSLWRKRPASGRAER
jgi:glycosyltransferase involved in cell wall biosynthesis